MGKTIKIKNNNLPEIIKDNKGDKIVKQDGTVIIKKT